MDLHRALLLRLAEQKFTHMRDQVAAGLRRTPIGNGAQLHGSATAWEMCLVASEHDLDGVLEWALAETVDQQVRPLIEALLPAERQILALVTPEGAEALIEAEIEAEEMAEALRAQGCLAPPLLEYLPLGVDDAWLGAELTRRVRRRAEEIAMLRDEAGTVVQ